jgi:hypothetical protein
MPIAAAPIKVISIAINKMVRFLFDIHNNGMERSFKQHKNGMNSKGMIKMG